jgi:hypothetical protein
MMTVFEKGRTVTQGRATLFNFSASTIFPQHQYPPIWRAFLFVSTRRGKTALPSCQSTRLIKMFFGCPLP